MTEKQERILKSALELFAKEGYTATSTKQVATHAHVSEGLIFRHFTNKEGLLQAVIEQGQQQAGFLIDRAIHASTPEEVIKKTISLPFDVPKEDYEFWRLQFKLKWELKAHSGHHMEPLAKALKKAFAELGYTQPAIEAEYLITSMDGLAGALLKGGLSKPEDLLKLILQKYKLL